jgi:cytochrome b5
MKKYIVSGAVLSLALVATSAFAATYTTQDVATHSTESDCWAIVSGKVYNLTPIMNAHPGGKAAILAACGKDATTAFTTMGGSGHPTSAVMQLENYLLGALVATPATTTATSTTPTPIATTTATTTTPTPPSLPQPLRMKEWKLNIEENGKVLLRGVVESVASGTIKVKTWGGVWTVNTPQSAELLPWKMQKGKVHIDHFRVGDLVGVQGVISPADTMTVIGYTVRNRTDHDDDRKSSRNDDSVKKELEKQKEKIEKELEKRKKDLEKKEKEHDRDDD